MKIEKIYKIFIKNYQDINNAKVRNQYGILGSILGILINTVLATIKITIGIFANSISIIADGINNFSDSGSSIISLVGFKIANKPGDEKHPYGHFRVEYITGFLISIIILLVGLNLGKSSIFRIFTKENVNINNFILYMLIFSMILKGVQYFVNKDIGTRIDSKTILATSIDARNDILATMIVLIGNFIGSRYGIYIDGYLGILISIIIVWSGIQLAMDTASSLIGERPSPKLIEDIRKMILENKEVIGIHDLIVHNYGVGKVFATAHIEVDSKKDIMYSHELVDGIERNIADILDINFVAHLDPVEIDNPIIAICKPIIEEGMVEFGGLKDLHDLRCIQGKNRVNIIFDVIKDYNSTILEDDFVDYIDAKLKDINKSYNAIVTFDKQYTNL